MRRIPARPRRARRARIALYGHDTCGLGHLQRNLALAGALSELPGGADVLLVTGSPHAQRFSRPPGVELLVLPAVRKTTDGEYRADVLDIPLEDLVDLRAAAATAALLAFDPDVFIVDKTPTGFRGELLSALSALRHNGTTNILGLRDVLDSPEVAAAEWIRDQGPEAAADLFEEVWVYGDAEVHDLTRDLGAGAGFRFLGYLAEGRPEVADPLPRNDPRSRTVLATVGGGIDAAALVRTLVATPLPARTELVLLPGPFADEQLRGELDRAAATRRDLHVVGFSAAASHWLAEADAVVCMGGYNTVTEILATDTPALVVPRTRPRREQLVRARSLQRVGALDLLPLPDPGRPAPADLAAWITAALGGGAAQRDRLVTARTRIARDGLDAVRDRTAELLDATQELISRAQ
ncbi:glycosyltransferase family protein [Kineococcus gynurae]|uniref:Glycosyltransferase family protein n=1 Tax=Kineococcus gynurae TaxID=452979 RepID=A0ABV5LXI5_9ACTN